MKTYLQNYRIAQPPLADKNVINSCPAFEFTVSVTFHRRSTERQKVPDIALVVFSFSAQFERRPEFRDLGRDPDHVNSDRRDQQHLRVTVPTAKSLLNQHLPEALVNLLKEGSIGIGQHRKVDDSTIWGQFTGRVDLGRDPSGSISASMGDAVPGKGPVTRGARPGVSLLEVDRAV